MSIGIEGIKFFNLTSQPLNQYFLEFLVELLKENDIAATVETHDVTGLPLKDVKKLLAGGRAALLDPVVSESLISQFPALPTEVKALSCADSLFFTDGQWWPRLNLKEALRQLIVRKARTLDIKESAYVIGEGATLRVLAALVVSFGFSKVYLVGPAEDDLQAQMAQMKKSFVGIDWRPMDASHLTMQTVGATLLINSISLSDNSNLQSDLAYFNFMKNQGLVVDLETLPFENALLEEAQRAGLRTLSGIEVRCQQDYSFMEKLGFSGLISLEDFSRRWRERLSSKSSP